MRIILKCILICLIIGITSVRAQNKQVIDSLKKQNLIESNQKIVVNNLNEISYYFEAINIDSSLVYSNKSRYLSIEIGYKQGLALSHLYTARSLMEKDILKKAIEHYNISLNIFIELEDSIDMLYCYQGLAYVYSYGFGQIKSLNYDFKALRIAEGLKDSNSLSIIYNNLGTIYTKLGNYNAALLYYNKTIDIEEQFQVPIDMAITHSNVGILKLENDNFEEAADNYNIVIRLLPEIKEAYTLSYLYLSLASYYTEGGNFDSAKYYIDNANIILEENSYQHIKVRALRKEGELLFKKKEYKKSIFYLSECVKLSKSIGITEYFSDIYKMKGEAYSHLGMYQKAYDLLQLASSADDSLQNKKTSSFLGDFEYDQMTKETEKRILEMELKDQKLENVSIKMKFESTIAIVIIVLLILIIISGIFLYLRIRKINSKLKSQHDLINSQKFQLEENVKKLTISENSLLKLNATKDKLFSIIAHDLRSPFNNILGFSDMLIENISIFEINDSKKYLGFINSSAQNTLNLLDNLLNWAKTHSDKINFNPRKVVLSEIIKETIENSNTIASIKNIEFNNLQLDEINVVADLNMLQTILRNLISNAIKFTNSNGKIDISAISIDGFAQVTVTDNGVGMSKETIDKLFKIETNESTIGTANEKGSGLGLLLCQEFVEIQGGQIWVESEVGKGSSFKFTLPVDKSIK